MVDVESIDLPGIKDPADLAHIKVSFNSPVDIREWVKITTHNAECLVYHDWPSNLWSKSYEEIIEFLKNRFRETKDVQEYYLCILYLSHDMDPDELFVPWKESPNYRRLLGEESSGHTSVAPPKTIVEQMQSGVEQGIRSIGLAGGSK